MEINQLEEVELGGITQWIRICGSDTSNPVLLLMQLGPGLPIINDAPRFEHLLALKRAFTVVYWDQRGTGLTLRADSTPDDLRARRMVEDAISMMEFLRDRFGAKPFVVGFSFGATFAAQAAVERPDLVETLVAVGMDIDVPAGELNAYEFALGEAHRRHNRRAIRQLEAMWPPPHLDAKRFTTRVRWTANFGGVATNGNYNSQLRALLTSLVRSPDYSIKDVIRTVRGIGATQAALLPELAATDLVNTMPWIGVPIVMVQGRLDQVAPGAAAQRFYDWVAAPQKQLVWFEQSAHTPHLEEPRKFRDLLISLRANRFADS
jgi:pimeloyl-ACP methyl ester carboxylesterase